MFAVPCLVQTVYGLAHNFWSKNSLCFSSKNDAVQNSRVLYFRDCDKQVIFHCDEVHTLVGAGSAEGSLDAKNISKRHEQEENFNVQEQLL